MESLWYCWHRLLCGSKLSFGKPRHNGSSTGVSQHNTIELIVVAVVAESVARRQTCVDSYTIWQPIRPLDSSLSLSLSHSNHSSLLPFYLHHINGKIILLVLYQFIVGSFIFILLSFT